MTRDEHLRWAKDRAVEIANTGDLPMALASFTSDLLKHPETWPLAGPVGENGARLLIAKLVSSPSDMVMLIEGTL